MQIDLSKCKAQSRAFRALRPGNTVCNPWGRGLGKSWFDRLHWYTRVAQWDGVERSKGALGGTFRGVRGVLLMPTLKQAKKVHGDLVAAELSPGGPWGFLGGKINHTDWKITFPGGSWIQWVSAENAHDNRGIRCDFVDVDEADDVPPEVFSSVVGPWFSEPFSLRETLISGTPRRGRYGLLWKAYRTWPKGEPGSPPVPNHYSFHATYKDAPLIVDPALVEQERQRLRGTPEIFAREWECDFDSGEGVVYPFFDLDLHVREPDYGVPWTEILVGVDHGFEDAGVILVLGVLGSGADAVVHVIEEVYERHRETSWWVSKAADVALRYRQWRQRWYCDPSRPDRIVDMRKGIRDAAERERVSVNVFFEDAENEIEAGVAAVADRLAPRTREDDSRDARLYVSPRCQNTILEFGLYRRRRDPKNKDRILDDIEDRNNHALDSLRYCVCTRFGKPAATRYEYRPPSREYRVL